METYYRMAKNGNCFVLTKKGYEKTPEAVKPEREIGKPLKGYEEYVPSSWLEKGYVREQEAAAEDE